MSRTSIAMLIILGAFIACYFLIALSPTASFITQLTRKNAQTSQESTQPLTSLSFSQQLVAINPNEQNFIDIIISTSESADVTQLEIAYDPLIVTVSDIVPGGYYQTPQEILKNINVNNGRISYAITCKASAVCMNHSRNNIARIYFTTNRPLTTTETSMHLMPKSLIRTDKESRKVTLGEPIQIHFAGQIATEASPAATVERLLK